MLDPNPTRYRQANKRLARLIQKIRVDNNERILDMANRLGIGPAEVSQVETGRIPMTTEWLDNLQRAYGLSDERRAQIEAASQLESR